MKKPLRSALGDGGLLQGAAAAAVIGVTGSSSLGEAEAIVATAAALNPTRIVDLGCGTGKYGFLLRERLDLACGRADRSVWQVRIDAVDGYAPYLTDLHRSVYDEVIVADVREFVATASGRYELALALDVLEHFEPDDGAEFIRATLRISDHLIVSTPRGYYQQEGRANQLERHLSWWPAAELERAARSAGARIRVRRDRWATIAVFSTVGEAAVVADPFWRAAVIEVRSRLVPEVVWCRLRGKAGPG